MEEERERERGNVEKFQINIVLRTTPITFAVPLNRVVTCVARLPDVGRWQTTEEPSTSL
jgi:hypothetical protein